MYDWSIFISEPLGFVININYISGNKNVHLFTMLYLKKNFTKQLTIRVGQCGGGWGGFRKKRLQTNL